MVIGLMLSMEGVLVIHMVSTCDTHYILLLLIKKNLEPNNKLAFTVTEHTQLPQLDDLIMM